MGDMGVQLAGLGCECTRLVSSPALSKRNVPGFMLQPHILPEGGLQKRPEGAPYDVVGRLSMPVGGLLQPDRKPEVVRRRFERVLHGQ